MPALFTNASAGTITDAPLGPTATTINSFAFQFLPTVAAPDFLYLTVDPNGVGGLPEIVKVTAHTASATAVTVVRYQQPGSNIAASGRTHVAGTIWRQSATQADYDELPFRKMTATGDILYGSAANTVSRLAIGATNSVLTVVGGVPTWPAAPVPTLYTPTVTLTGATVTSPVGYTLKTSGELRVWVTFTLSVGGSSNLSISVPGGYTTPAAVGVGHVGPAGGSTPSFLQAASGALTAVTGTGMSWAAGAITAYATIPTTV